MRLLEFIGKISEDSDPFGDARMVSHYVAYGAGMALDQIRKEADFMDQFQEWYADDTGMEPEDDESAFNEWLEEETSNRAHRVYLELQQGMKQGPNGGIMLFRYITAPVTLPQTFHTQPVGIYWSYDPIWAKAHWGADESPGGEQHIEWLIIGEVDAAGVDWETTIAQGVLYPSEGEVQVRKGAPVNILDLRPEQAADSAYGDDPRPGQDAAAAHWKQQPPFQPVQLKASL